MTVEDHGADMAQSVPDDILYTLGEGRVGMIQLNVDMLEKIARALSARLCNCFSFGIWQNTSFDKRFLKHCKESHQYVSSDLILTNSKMGVSLFH